jgi:Protein of unknown function (DUF1569)
MDTWLARARQEIDEATAGMAAEAWRRAPEGKWTAAQILEHLSLTFGGTAKMLEKRLAAEKPDTMRSRTVKEFVMQVALFLRQEIPEGRTAPEGVRPQGIEGEEALRRIREYLGTMEQRIDEAEKRWGTSAKIAVHPILGPLTADRWRKFHFIHTRHHMRQVRERRGVAVGSAAGK